MNPEQKLKFIHADVERELLNQAAHYRTLTPQTLYEPVAYMIALGGKRVRPMLACIGNLLAGGDYRTCLPLAGGLELFHNFTLVHDDVMDEAPIRRGRETVHKHYGLNTAILSGDVMFTEAMMQIIHGSNGHNDRILPVFLKAAAQVCEGQQWDMDFEQGSSVTLPQYMKMIEYKTAVLLAASLSLGALSAGAEAALAHKLYELGIAAGISFQLQDDWLDAFGNPSETGKQPGGDILANKKTWLMISLFNSCSKEHRVRLTDLMNEVNPDIKIKTMLALFDQYELREGLQNEVQKKKKEAFDLLDSLQADPEAKEVLRAFLFTLAGRKN